MGESKVVLLRIFSYRNWNTRKDCGMKSWPNWNICSQNKILLRAEAQVGTGETLGEIWGFCFFYADITLNFSWKLISGVLPGYPAVHPPGYNAKAPAPFNLIYFRLRLIGRINSNLASISETFK